MNKDNKLINRKRNNYLREIFNSNWLFPFEEESWLSNQFSSELQEDKDNYYIKAELPGMPKDKINIELVNNQLRIHAEKEEEKETTDKKYHFSEISYGSFTRTYSLPGTVNSQGIQAKYENGVLFITIPKSAESKARQIKIN